MKDKISQKGDLNKKRDQNNETRDLKKKIRDLADLDENKRYLTTENEI